MMSKPIRVVVVSTERAHLQLLLLAQRWFHRRELNARHFSFHENTVFLARWRNELFAWTASHCFQFFGGKDMACHHLDVSKAGFSHNLPVARFGYSPAQTSGPGRLKSRTEFRIDPLGEDNI
ncbi:MAG: hypothetical protein MAG451_00821 [Anaerolineales bacterium]|nr:hypothetical protein [Anaerolineales bacterium]